MVIIDGIAVNLPLQAFEEGSSSTHSLTPAEEAIISNFKWYVQRVNTKPQHDPFSKFVSYLYTYKKRIDKMGFVIHPYTMSVVGQWKSWQWSRYIAKKTDEERKRMSRESSQRWRQNQKEKAQKKADREHELEQQLLLLQRQLSASRNEEDDRNTSVCFVPLRPEDVKQEDED